MRHLLILPFLVAALTAITAGRATPESAPTATAEGDDSLCIELRAVADTASAETKYRIATFVEHLAERGETICDGHAFALRCLTEAADEGNPQALNYLGFKYLRGDGVTVDSVRGINMIHRAAEAGDARSYNNLGWLYMQGTGVPKDYAEAARWFELASAQGVATAAAMLGDFYRDGLGVAADTVRADSLYTLAVRRGLADAQLRLIDLHRDDWKSLPADSALRLGLSFYPAPGPAAGIVLFEQAANQGNAQAMALLGDAFSRGVGVGYDHTRSLAWFYRAALAGNPSAQFVVAELLDMLPDALSDILPLINDPYIIDDPQYWYSRASEAGIHDAGQASVRLLQLPPDSINQ